MNTEKMKDREERQLFLYENGIPVYHKVIYSQVVTILNCIVESFDELLVHGNGFHVET